MLILIEKNKMSIKVIFISVKGIAIWFFWHIWSQQPERTLLDLIIHCATRFFLIFWNFTKMGRISEKCQISMCVCGPPPVAHLQNWGGGHKFGKILGVHVAHLNFFAVAQLAE